MRKAILTILLGTLYSTVSYGLYPQTGFPPTPTVNPVVVYDAPNVNAGMPNYPVNNPLLSQWLQVQQQDIYFQQKQLQIQLNQQRIQMQQMHEYQMQQQQKQFDKALETTVNDCQKMDLNAASYQDRARCQNVQHHLQYSTPITDADIGLTQ